MWIKEIKKDGIKMMNKWVGETVLKVMVTSF